MNLKSIFTGGTSNYHEIDNPNAACLYGRTPLQFAVRHGHREIMDIEKLLEFWPLMLMTLMIQAPMEKFPQLFVQQF